MNRLAIVSPGRISDGGGTVSRELHAAMESLLGEPVPSAGIPGRGRAELPAEVREARSVIFLGTRAVPDDRYRSVFWPLSVAPLDASINKLPHVGIENRTRQRLLRLRLSHAVSSADALIFGSHYARSLYMAQYAAGARLPYTVMSGNAPPSLNFDRSAAAAPAPTAGPLQILVCSHLDAYKGLLEFVEALALVPESIRQSCQVRIAGADREPGYAVAVRSAVKRHGLDDLVTIAPARGAELAELYQRADLFVFPSLCENAGSFSLFDAFHAGLPVLCSDRSSLPEICKGTAELVNPFETVAFTRALVRLITSSSDREELAARSVRWRSESPDWVGRARQVVDFINRLEETGSQV